MYYLRQLLDVFSGGDYTRAIKRDKVIQKNLEVIHKCDAVMRKWITVVHKRNEVSQKRGEVKTKRIDISQMRGVVADKRKEVAQKRAGIVLRLYSENQDLKAIGSITRFSVARIKTILAEKKA
jgi:hypothetical protein